MLHQKWNFEVEFSDVQADDNFRSGVILTRCVVSYKLKTVLALEHSSPLLAIEK